MRSTGRFLAVVGLISLAACAATSPEGPFPAQQALIGMTEQEVLACAGKPKTRSSSGGGTVLTYRRAAPVFEESFAGSRGSVPCPRHGCEAVIVLKDGRVAEARYHPSPPSVGGCEHCEEILRNCLP